MRNLFFFFLCFAFHTIAYSQQGENPLPYVQKEPPYDIAPSYPGGINAMNTYLQDSLRYPLDELIKKKEGYVSMKFEVTKSGKLVNIQPINGVPGAPNFVKESIRLLNAMPSWIPATKKGKKVQVEYYLNIPFKLKKTKSDQKQKK